MNRVRLCEEAIKEDIVTMIVQICSAICQFLQGILLLTLKGFPAMRIEGTEASTIKCDSIQV
jgi:hypothetical protein